jgi:CubicO group peptidase (beta-lactamase class C family)
MESKPKDFDDIVADQIRSLIAKHADESGFSGVCLVKRGDDILVHEAYGFAHRGFGVPNTVHTRFDNASVTKVFTAAAILRLIVSGKVTLETQVMPFLGIDGTQISNDVNIFHCLTHTSGIADDADEEAGEVYEALFVDKPNYAIRQMADFLPQFAYKQSVFPPGEGVRYNNCAFTLIRLVIEKTTGMSYRDYVRQNVFAPAGMDGADFCAMDGVNTNLAEHYKRIDHDDGTVEWRKNIYSYPPVGSPDGGATVTAMDLDRFMRSVVSGTLLGEEGSQLLQRPHVLVEQHDDCTLMNGFAFEFKLDTDGQVLRMNKEGFKAGVSSMLAYYPSIDTTVVLLANIEYSVWTMLREIETLLFV